MLSCQVLFTINNSNRWGITVNPYKHSFGQWGNGVIFISVLIIEELAGRVA